MSEFHTAFYRTCPVHKNVEHPLWRKCPKCEEVITYSEEEIKSYGEYILKLANYVIRRKTRMIPLNDETGTMLNNDLFNNWLTQKEKKS